MNYIEIENRIENEIIKKIGFHYDLLKLNGIQYVIKLYRENLVFNSNYTSEIQIEFYKSDDFYDIIEFFIYRNGEFYLKDEYLSDLENDILLMISTVTKAN